ncbi:MAG: protein-L-isoaspartate(D-aspartate) O-methyltransferase [Planctomycetia bacterium]|nr:MAG: protein-L-isoaspartate(D-aspartate) O-methyltransferase [Planctomycetia bacterium]
MENAHVPSPAYFAARRAEMVRSQLAARGIRDARVLAAMGEIPRERFVLPELIDAAYDDCALAIDCNQTISQPYIVAAMTELLRPLPTHRVLEVGAGSGYQTAVLARLVSHVYAIEWHAPLVEQAARRLTELNVQNVTFRCGDGTLGWPDQAPFDGILVAAGGPVVPDALRDQLAPGGRLVIPVGPLQDQALVVITRTECGFETQEAMKCRFVKLVGENGWKP